MKASSLRLTILVLSGIFIAIADGANAQSPENAASATNAGHQAAAVLSPVNVSARPIGSFGISVRARREELSKRVADLTVLAVVPNSDADRQGLGPLTQILSVDGGDVREFTSSFDKGSDLDAKLIGRKKGDEITLEVLILGAKKSKRVTLVEGHGVHDFPNQSDSEIEPYRTIHVGVSH